jgi:tetrahydromethanopterin S-methyltransferase subunit F
LVKVVAQLIAAGAAIGVAEKIQALLERFAPKIAKYMKIVFNKILEYTSKKINAAIGPLADTMFPNQRFQFLDMKIEVNELIKCLFSKITGGLVGQILGALKDIVNKCDPSRGRSSGGVTGGGSTGTAPYVPICSVEELTGNVIAANIGDIDKTVEDVTKSVETFLNDIQSGLSVAGQVGGIAGQVGGLLGGLGGIKIPNINGSIAAALSFENITLDLFGCDSKPNCAASDFYTLQEGAGAAEEAQLPRPAQVTEAAKDPGPVTPAVTQPFAPPAKNTPDLKILKQIMKLKQLHRRRT